ncbi:MAG: hypothetical protein ABFD91_14650 [Anaerohalosphaeraceae bacterium]
MNHPGNGIPAFDKNGNLPPGIFKVTLEEVKTSLTWSKRRQELFAGLERAVDNLNAAGVLQIYIDGSFTTNKDEPGDIDGCWVPNREVDTKILDPVFFALRPPREAMKIKYGVDFLIAGVKLNDGGCLVEDFFQIDRDGNAKGILLLDL